MRNGVVGAITGVISALLVYAIERWLDPTPSSLMDTLSLFPDYIEHLISPGAVFGLVSSVGLSLIPGSKARFTNYILWILLCVGIYLVAALVALFLFSLGLGTILGLPFAIAGGFGAFLVGLTYKFTLAGNKSILTNKRVLITVAAGAISAALSYIFMIAWTYFESGGSFSAVQQLLLHIMWQPLVLLVLTWSDRKDPQDTTTTTEPLITN